MAPSSVFYLKFVGSVSVGLLTGISYTLTSLTLPTLLCLPSATIASQAFTTLTRRTAWTVRLWSVVSTSSFLLAYVLSPRGARHPYLLWASLMVTGSVLSDVVTDNVLEGMARKQVLVGSARPSEGGKGKGKGERMGRMEASYDVVGDSEEGGSASEEGEEEIVNGEQVRNALQAFNISQRVRTVLVGLGFVMSVIGIWGDGA